MTRLLAILMLLPAIASAAGLGVYNPAQHAVNGFMPTQLPGLRLWIEAGRASATNGGAISFVSDFGPDLIHVTNSGGSKTPTLGNLNGRAAMVFDGVDDYFATALSLNFSNKFLSIAIAGTRNNAQFGIIIEQGTNYNYQKPAFACFVNDSFGSPTVYPYIETAYNANVGYNVGYIATNGINQNQYVYFSSTDVGLVGTNETKSYLSGLELTQYTSGFSADNTDRVGGILPLYIGGRGGAGGLNANIGEILLYNTILSESQRLQVERYLGTKYGIVVK